MLSYFTSTPRYLKEGESGGEKRIGWWWGRALAPLLGTHFATVCMSLSPRPHKFTRTILSLGRDLASCMA